MHIKEWKEFRQTGLLVFVNMFLHIFGWAIAIESDDVTEEVRSVYPIKVSCKGFSEDTIHSAYEKLNQYMVNHNSKDGTIK